MSPLAPTRIQRRLLKKTQAAMPERLREVPRTEWPPAYASGTDGPVRVLRSREFMVQQYDEPGGIVRLSVNCAWLLTTGDWGEGITWDDLQRVKRECGFGDRCAVELYPPDVDVVNIANIRHLWILPEAPPYMWTDDRVATPRKLGL